MAVIKLRRDTAAQWQALDPILAQGEPGWDLTNKELRIGDGVTSWTNLPIVGTGGGGGGGDIEAALASEILARIAEDNDIRSDLDSEASTRANEDISLNASTLKKANNLSDLTDVTAARANLQFTETVQDLVGAFTLGGNGLTFTYNDAGNQAVIDVNVDGLGIEITGDTLRLRDGGVSLSKLANIGNGRVLGNVSGSAAAPVELTAAQLKTLLAIGTADITGLGALATLNTVGSAQITDGSIVDGDIAAGAAIALSKLGPMSNNRFLGNVSGGSATPAQLTVAEVKTALAIVAADISGLGTLATLNSVGSAQITDGSIVDGDINATAAIAISKLATIGNNRILGNVSGGTANPTELTAAQVKTLLGLASGDLSDFTESVQDVIGNLVTAGGSGLSATYNDGANTWVLDVNVDNATLEISTDTVRIKDAGVSLSKLATIANGTVLGNVSGSTASPSALTASQLKTLLAISSSDVSGLGALATKSTVASADITDGTIVNGDISGSAAIALSKLATITNNRVLGNVSGSTAAPSELTASQLKTLLALVATDVTDFTESVQDVVGALSAGGSGLTMTYNDAANTLVLDVNVDGSTIEISSDTLRIKDGGVGLAKLASIANNTILGNVSGSTGAPAALTATQVNALVNPGTYNVKHYGAVGNGVADDTTAIQAAITACPAGSVVYFPPGRYVVSSTLTIGMGITLQGAMAPRFAHYQESGGEAIGSVLKMATTFTGSAVISATAAAPPSFTTGAIRITRLVIDGQDTVGNTADGILCTGRLYDPRIENVTISKVLGNGVRFLEATGNRPLGAQLFGVMATNVGLAGFDLDFADSFIADCYSLSAGTSGFIIRRQANTTITGCRSEWSGDHGYYFTEDLAGGGTMTGCVSDRSDKNGVYIDATSGSGSMVFTGCAFRRDGRNGNSGGGNYAAFRLAGTTQPVVLTGFTISPGVDDDNTGTNSPQIGIRASGSRSFVFSNGHIHAATTAVTDDGDNTTFQRGLGVTTATGTLASPTYSYSQAATVPSGTIRLDGNTAIGFNKAPAGSALIDSTSSVTSGAQARWQYTGTTGNNQPIVYVEGVEGVGYGYGARVTGDTIFRFIADASGSLAWGSGSATRDTTFGRTAAGELTANGTLKATNHSTTGLTGATQASRYVGATTSGAPVSGTFLNGDFIIARDGQVWVCTAGGTPGTWSQAGGSGSFVALTGNQTIAGDKTFTNPTTHSATSADTSPFNRAIDLAMMNSSSTNGNYMTFGHYASDGSIADGFFFQCLDHTAHTGRIGISTRTSGGFGTRFTVDDAVTVATGTVLKSRLVRNQQSGTTYTLVIGDEGKLVELSNASAITLTVPPNSSVAFENGTQINLLQTAAGQVTVTPGSGVTINGSPGLKLTGQWSAATLIKRTTDTWVLIGDITS